MIFYRETSTVYVIMNKLKAMNFKDFDISFLIIIYNIRDHFSIPLSS